VPKCAHYVGYHRSGLPVCIEILYNGLGAPYPRLAVEVPRAKYQKMTWADNPQHVRGAYVVKPSQNI
jgi:hypothetical protein